MLNPDIHDPTWIAAREEQWKTVAKFHKKEFSRKQMEVLRAWFMGEPFEFGNDEKYGKLEFAWSLAWALSPIQTKERWTRLIFEDCKVWMQTNYDVTWAMRMLGAFGGNYREYGWDFATELEAAQWVLGDHFINGKYIFEGREVIYPYNAEGLLGDWRFQISRWFSGVYLYHEDFVGCHFLNHFKQAVHHVHPAYYSKLASQKIYNSQRDLHGFLRRLNQFENWIETAAKENKYPVIGVEKRFEFAKSLKDYFESSEPPLLLQELYAWAISPDYVMPDRFDPMPVEQDMP